MPPALDDESASGERPGADRRALGPLHGASHRAGVRRNAVQFRERPRHSEGQLRAGSETGMGRKRSMDLDRGAAVDRVVRQKPPGEHEGTIRVFSADLQRGRRLGRQQQRWCGRSRTDAAKAPPERPAQIENAEMQAGRRFDEDRLAHRSDATGVTGVARTCAAISDIASRSRGPAVLSTMICRRPISLSTNSRARR